MLIAALCLTAAIAGLTGTWSPCGFSTVETLGAAAQRGMRGVTAVSSVTFAAGAVLGGAVTFGVLAEIGNLAKGVGGTAATVVAIVVAALAAFGEIRGVRIVPQIRRQVPEPWRRGMPLPLAAGLYGVLLGLGFTTFVLSWAVWALAGIAVTIGDPLLGIAIGVAFGLGRATPVAALAPTAFEGKGERILTAMAERPASLQLMRRADALGLALSALALVVAPAKAATLLDANGTDPSAAGPDIAWERPGTGGILLRGGQQIVLPGDVPAVGGSMIAWRNGAHVTVANRATGQPVLQFDAPGVDKLAVSDAWVAVRRTNGRHDSLEARALAAPQSVRSIAGATFPDQIGRPTLDGARLLFSVSRGRSTKIVQDNLSSRRRKTLRHGRSVQYLNPSLLGGRLLYVRVTRCRQELRLARPRRDRVFMKLPPIAAQDVGYDPGHTHQGSRRPCGGGAHAPAGRVFGTTALAPGAALVTVLSEAPNGTLAPSLYSVGRR